MYPRLLWARSHLPIVPTVLSPVPGVEQVFNNYLLNDLYHTVTSRKFLVQILAAAAKRHSWDFAITFSLYKCKSQIHSELYLSMDHNGPKALTKSLQFLVARGMSWMSPAYVIPYSNFII